MTERAQALTNELSRFGHLLDRDIERLSKDELLALDFSTHEIVSLLQTYFPHNYDQFLKGIAPETITNPLYLRRLRLFLRETYTQLTLPQPNEPQKEISGGTIPEQIHTLVEQYEHHQRNAQERGKLGKLWQNQIKEYNRRVLRALGLDSDLINTSPTSPQAAQTVEVARSFHELAKTTSTESRQNRNDPKQQNVVYRLLEERYKNLATISQQQKQELVQAYFDIAEIEEVAPTPLVEDFSTHETLVLLTSAVSRGVVSPSELNKSSQTAKHLRPDGIPLSQDLGEYALGLQLAEYVRTTNLLSHLYQGDDLLLQQNRLRHRFQDRLIGLGLNLGSAQILLTKFETLKAVFPSYSRLGEMAKAFLSQKPGATFARGKTQQQGVPATTLFSPTSLIGRLFNFTFSFMGPGTAVGDGLATGFNRLVGGVGNAVSLARTTRQAGQMALTTARAGFVAAKASPYLLPALLIISAVFLLGFLPGFSGSEIFTVDSAALLAPKGIEPIEEAPPGDEYIAGPAIPPLLADCDETERDCRWPTTGCITQGPPHGQNESLNGIDIGAGHGTPVWATHPGVVIEVVTSFEDYQYESQSWGNYVKIEGVDPNGNKYYTQYAHLQAAGIEEARVYEGMPVVAGQQIGTVDSTGTTYGSGPGGTGSHLHYEYRLGGNINEILPYAVPDCGGIGEPSCGSLMGDKLCV